MIAAWLPVYLGLSYSWVFRGRERMDFDALINVVLKLSMLILSLVCLVAWRAAPRPDSGVGRRRHASPSSWRWRSTGASGFHRSACRPPDGARAHSRRRADAGHRTGRRCSALYRRQHPLQARSSRSGGLVRGGLGHRGHARRARLDPGGDDVSAPVESRRPTRASSSGRCAWPFGPCCSWPCSGPSEPTSSPMWRSASSTADRNSVQPAGSCELSRRRSCSSTSTCCSAMPFLRPERPGRLAGAKLAAVLVTTGLEFVLVPWCQARFANGGIGIMFAMAAGELVMVAAALPADPRGRRRSACSSTWLAGCSLAPPRCC